MEECTRTLEGAALFVDRSTASSSREGHEIERKRLADIQKAAHPHSMPSPDDVNPVVFEHGGSNITYLTGLMQQILPEVHSKILVAAQKAMSESFLANSRSKSTKKVHGRNWEVNLQSLGVRSIQYASYYNRQEALKPSEKRRIRLEMRKKIAERRDKQKEYERKTYGNELKKGQVHIGVNLYSKAELEREESAVLKLQMAELKAQEDGVVLFNPHADDVDWAAIDYEYDPLADEHLKDYLRTDGATVYTIIILLNDRSQFHGGEVFIRKDKAGHHGFAGAGRGTGTESTNTKNSDTDIDGNDYEDEYDEEDPDDVGFVGYEDIHPEAHFAGDAGRSISVSDAERKKNLKELRKATLDRASDPHIGAREYGRPAQDGIKNRKSNNGSGGGAAGADHALEMQLKHPHYNAFHTRISRYTPDRGNLLIIRSDYEHGIQPILNGRRNALIIEYWAYEDARVEERRPMSEKEGRPLPRRWQEL